MTEDELMAVVGRLYINSLVNQREVARLRTLVQEYEVIAKTPDEDVRYVEDLDGVVPAAD